MTVIHSGATMINAEATIKFEKDAGYLKELAQQLLNERNEMYEAMQEFVDRVDKGEIRSNRTYNKFKSILAKARGDKC